MRRLTYLNSRGESVVFDTFPLFINSLTGVTESDANVQMLRAPFQDGATYVDTRLEPRYPVLKGAIADRFAVDEHRSRILRVCNPSLGLGKLILEINGVTREIYGAVDGIPSFPEKGDDPYQRFLISWVCPNPYWQDINPTNVKLEDYVSNFSFPFSFPVSFATRGDLRTLVNIGHAPTPVKITFRGEAINPRITKVDTREYIQVNRTIPDGYSLVINTDLEGRIVRIVGPDGVETNAIGHISRHSTFFDLDIGENKLSFLTEGGKPDVYVEYRNRYLGV